jgi:hypothetical protein
MRKAFVKMKLKSCILCLFCVLLLSACGKTLTCRICNRTIGDDEHAVNVIRISDYVDLDEVLGQNADAPSGVVSGNDVICETCQYRYAGIMAGHCRNCLTELGDENPAFYDYDILDDKWYDVGYCEACAKERWGDSYVQHAKQPWCSECGQPFGSSVKEYNDSGVCEICAETVFG